MFSCEYCEIFKNIYFEEHLRTIASVDFRKFLEKTLAWKYFLFFNFSLLARKTGKFESKWEALI